MQYTSMMGIFTLLDGELQHADVAFAATVFELARQGFITLKQGDPKFQEVVICRTSDKEVHTEGDRMVLAKLFGDSTGTPGATITIKSPMLVAQHEPDSFSSMRRLYCAQDVMNDVHETFLYHKFIKKVRPLEQVRWWRAELIAFLAVVCVMIALFTRSAEWGLIAAFVALIVYFSAWLVVLAPHGRRRFNLTHAGRATADALRERIRLPENEPMTPAVIRALAMRDLTDVSAKPDWWQAMWLPSVVNGMFNTLAESSTQAPTNNPRTAEKREYYLKDRLHKPTLGLSKN